MRNLQGVVNFAVQADHRVKFSKSEKSYKYLDLKRVWKNESNDDTNCNWCARYSQQRIGTGTRGQMETIIIKIVQNTEKSHG